MPPTCELCGYTGPSVSERLVAWRNTSDRPMFSVLERCRDDAACRARVEGSGREWPVRERGAK